MVLRPLARTSQRLATQLFAPPVAGARRPDAAVPHARAATAIGMSPARTRAAGGGAGARAAVAGLAPPRPSAWGRIARATTVGLLAVASLVAGVGRFGPDSVRALGMDHGGRPVAQALVQQHRGADLSMVDWSKVVLRPKTATDPAILVALAASNSTLARGLLMDRFTSEPALEGLTAAERGVFDAVVGSKELEIGQAARQGLIKLIESAEFKALGFAGQVDALRGYLSHPALPAVVADEAAVWRAPVQELMRETLPDYAFATGAAPAEHRVVKIGDTVHDVYGPLSVSPDVGVLNTLDEVVAMLAGAPARIRALIDHVVLEPQRSTVDRFWGALWGNDAFRAFMTAEPGGVRVYPTAFAQNQTALDGTILHEGGHVDAAKQWGPDTDAPAWQEWRDAIATDLVAPSEYARHNPNEDRAEALQLFKQARDNPDQLAELKVLMAGRYRIIEREGWLLETAPSIA